MTVLHLTGEIHLSQALEAVPGALEYILALKPYDFARQRNLVRPTIWYLASRCIR